VLHGLQLCRRLGKQRGEMLCLIHLADPLIKANGFTAARQYCLEAVALARSLGNRWGEGFALLYLGNATRLLGHYGEAQEQLVRAHTILSEDGDRAMEAIAAALLGHLHNLMGDSNAARTWFNQFLLQLLQPFGAEWHEPELGGLLPLALFCHGRGDDQQALDYLARAVEIAQSYGWRQSQAQAFIMRGHTLNARQEWAAAEASYRQALALCQALENLYLASEGHAGIANLALQQGDLDRAQEQVEMILDILEVHPQAGMDEPFGNYLTCYHVLSATADPRAPRLLQQGHSLLQAYASHIPDELRCSFLERVPLHWALQQAHASGR
jgi:tetratricopeptide (TPR) repeat protein